MMSVPRPALLVLVSCALGLPARAADQEWGTLKGQVVYAGKKSIQETLKPDPKLCPRPKNAPIPNDALLVNPQNKGVRWAVVWLAADDDGKADHAAALPIHPDRKALRQKAVEMDQPCCRFEPHVVVLREGQDFVGKNSSSVNHNMKITGTGPNRAIGMNPLLGPGQKVTIAAKKWKSHYLPTIVQCNIHSWMGGRIFVFAHPYFAITDEDGKFEIKDAPAGKYRVIASHESCGWILGEKEPDKQGKLVTIKPGDVTDLGKIEMND